MTEISDGHLGRICWECFSNDVTFEQSPEFSKG